MDNIFVSVSNCSLKIALKLKVIGKDEQQLACLEAQFLISF